MALSPAHRFGQVIGEVLEAGVLALLEPFARTHGLYLDRKGSRACRTGKKCSWVDLNDNSHDLDFVLERGGSETALGTPVAFIETAWRRYTKHSRNKAQEIQGAIEPLAQLYSRVAPFKGAVLAGEFTQGALTQLHSLGFTVLHLSYASVVQAFAAIDVDAAFDESTADAEFSRKLGKIKRLGPKQLEQVSTILVDPHRADVRTFIDALAKTVLRRVERITIVALHGKHHEATSVIDAIQFIETYAGSRATMPIDRYEIEVCFSNGDSIKGSFRDKHDAVGFLSGYHRTG